jgi:hypothetical protein
MSMFTGSTSLIGLHLAVVCTVPDNWGHRFGPMILVSGVSMRVESGLKLFVK